MAACFESSYSPAMYSPVPESLWSDSTTAAGPKPLGWKLSGPAPGSQQQGPMSAAGPSFSRHADDGAAGPGQYATSASQHRHLTATKSGIPSATATTAAAKAASATTAVQRSPSNAVLGAGVAGYTSVVTRSPISPSGYAVPVNPHPVSNTSNGTSRTSQLQQHHTSPAHEPVTGYGSIPGIRADLQWTHSNSNSSFTQPSPDYAAAGPVFSTSNSSLNSHAASPAAAIAALAGCYTRTNSAPVGPTGYAAQHYAAREAPQQQQQAPNCSSKGHSLLMWNIKQAPPAAPAAAGQLPVAGRRAVTAGASGQQAGPAGQWAPNAYSSSSTSRPSSQEAASPGLSKLKQLASARLANRLGTPPLPGSGTVQDVSGSTRAFGSNTGAMQGSAPAAGRRAAAAAQQSSQQQQGQQQQGRQQQSPKQEPWQQQQQRPVLQTARTQDPGSGSSNSSARSFGRSNSRGAAGLAAHVATTHDPDSGRGGSGGNDGGSKKAGGSTFFGSIFNRQSQRSDSQAPKSNPSVPLIVDEYQEVERQPCPSCGRCFAEAALQQHMRICDKVFGQKRKVFDTTAHRLQGTGAAAASSRVRGNSAGGSGQQRQQQQRGARSNDQRPAASGAQSNKSKWKQQSAQLRAAMRAARPQAAGGAAGWAAGGAAQVEEVEDTRVLCPHCGRRFAELVAERHIPKCADIVAKPSRLKAAGGRAAYMRCNSGSR